MIRARKPLPRFTSPFKAVQRAVAHKHSPHTLKITMRKKLAGVRKRMSALRNANLRKPRA